MACIGKSSMAPTSRGTGTSCDQASQNRGLSSNTSFKVTRRPVTQFAMANWAPARPAPQLDR